MALTNWKKMENFKLSIFNFLQKKIDSNYMEKLEIFQQLILNFRAKQR